MKQHDVFPLQKWCQVRVRSVFRYTVLCGVGLLSLLLCLISPSLADTPPTAKIVGGNETAPGQYPFMVALLVAGDGIPADRQFCGGSLIHPNWVITAAHCLQSTTASAIHLGVGMHDLTSSSGEEITAKQIIIHPDYDSSSNDNDVALVELTRAAVLGSPISIASAASSYAGVTSTAIGWGTTSEGGTSADRLQHVDVPIVSNSTCNESYGGGITNNMVCAGFADGGKDACQGDSGGPLIIGGSSSPQLVGLTSFGTGCARPDFYGVYARATEYHAWIANYITEASETDGPFGLWNGFIDLVNIAELRNTSNASVTAQVNIHGSTGQLLSSTEVSIAAGAQQDVILNQLPGFSHNSYGIVRISNNVSGRIFYYRTRGSGFSDFEFAFGIPMSEAMTGTRYVGFNTFQPSNNPSEQANLVANWLSVVNVEDTPRNFQLRKFSGSGALLSSTSFTLNGRERIDLDGGHSNPGPNAVGLLEIIPQDASSEYLAQLIRYGYSSDPTSFDFAFPLIPLTGDTQRIVVPLGSSENAQNWLEVLNTTSSPQTITVELRRSNGSLAHSQSLALAGYAQAHINATSYLGAGINGQAVLTPEASRPAIAEAMFYFREPISGGIAAMYGSQAQVATANSVKGSFNLFLDMENYLRIVNPNTSSVNVLVSVDSIFSAGSSSSQTIPAQGMIQLPLHETFTYGTLKDSYGTVEVAPSSLGTHAEILRVKRESNGLPQFVAPSDLQ